MEERDSVGSLMLKLLFSDESDGELRHIPAPLTGLTRSTAEARPGRHICRDLTLVKSCFES